MPSLPSSAMLIAALVSVSLVTIIATYGFLQQTHYAAEAKEYVRESQETMEEVHVLSSKLKSAVLAHHRYLLTNDENFLEEYRSLKSKKLNELSHVRHEVLQHSLEDDIINMRRLTQKEPEQLRLVNELDASLKEIWKTLDQIITDYETKGIDLAITNLEAYVHQQVLPTRTILATILKQAAKDLDQHRANRENKIRSTRNFVLSIIFFSYFLQIVLIVLTYKQWRIAQTEAHNSRQRANELAVANEELAALNTQIRESSEAQMSAIVDTALDGLIMMNAQGVIIRFNPASEAIFGYKSEEIIGKRVDALLPEPYAKECLEHLRQHREQGLCNGMKHAHETMARRKNGTIFSMDLSMSMFLLGGELHFSWFVRDITQRKKAEADLMRYMTELEKSNRDLDDFAYIASHDLKEPLRGLFNHAQFLLEDYSDILDEEGQRRLGRLSILSQRMEQLVNDLLYFSRLGRSDLAIQPTDPNQLIFDVEHLIEALLKEKNAKIIIPTPLPQVICDKPRLTEVFRNLITNAIKYNDKDEKIIEIGFLSSATAPHGIEKNAFYIKDNGIGIDSQYHQEIFRINKRLQKTAEDEQSTGSGL
ncbi:MAG: PAS domain S-box protein, partial [Bdellovibrionales bacterium]